MNHTPAPWLYECKPGRADGFVFSESQPEGFNICTIEPDVRITHDDRRRSDDWVFSEQRAADARLIAAAPDLLAALQTIVNSEEYHGETVVCDFQTLQTVARAAIAKARGEA